ncbi:hypothetical protein [Candidatus Lokiarchaeum ossiferum]|uniref:hypothetical protein n=1 Tax=Candidatus Lokiarchaeum ossiferum TaxID=2951803 RepID=UPI00352FDAE0
MSHTLLLHEEQQQYSNSVTKMLSFLSHWGCLYSYHYTPLDLFESLTIVFHESEECLEKFHGQITECEFERQQIYKYKAMIHSIATDHQLDLNMSVFLSKMKDYYRNFETLLLKIHSQLTDIQETQAKLIESHRILFSPSFQFNEFNEILISVEKFCSFYGISPETFEELCFEEFNTAMIDHLSSRFVLHNEILVEKPFMGVETSRIIAMRVETPAGDLFREFMANAIENYCKHHKISFEQVFDAIKSEDYTDITF